ncbi:hypothetical protein BDV32DRAFT_97447 [Aspergillus pseudonomiae]|nr:hypothetical protein BDV32DRAFT_97447 [Aspergillus pseudonomiae]
MEVLGTVVAISFGAAMLYYAKRTDDFQTGLNSMLETYCTCTTAAQPICVRFFGYKRYLGCMAIKRPSWYFSECVLESTPKIWASLWAKDSLITIYGRLDLPAVETIIAVMTSYVFLIGGRRYRNLGWILCIFSGILLLAELGGAFNPVFSSSSKAKCIQRVIDEFGNIQGRDNPFYIEWTKKVDISSLSHEGLEHIMVRLDALMYGEGWDDLPKQLLASQRMRTASAVQSVN